MSKILQNFRSVKISDNNENELYEVIKSENNKNIPDKKQNQLNKIYNKRNTTIVGYFFMKKW